MITELPRFGFFTKEREVRFSSEPDEKRLDGSASIAVLSISRDCMDVRFVKLAGSEPAVV